MLKLTYAYFLFMTFRFTLIEVTLLAVILDLLLRKIISITYF